ADTYGVKYSTLKSRWIPKLEEIFEGSDNPPIRGLHGLTEWGWLVSSNYINQVVKQGCSVETFKSQYQLKPDAVLMAENQAEGQSNGVLAIAPRVSALDALNTQVLDVEMVEWMPRESGEDIALYTQILSTGMQQLFSVNSSLEKALLKQAEEEGKRLGAAMAMVKNR